MELVPICYQEDHAILRRLIASIWFSCTKRKIRHLGHLSVLDPPPISTRFPSINVSPTNVKRKP